MKDKQFAGDAFISFGNASAIFFFLPFRFRLVIAYASTYTGKEALTLVNYWKAPPHTLVIKR